MISTQKVNLITVMFVNGHYDTQRISNNDTLPCNVELVIT